MLKFSTITVVQVPSIFLALVSSFYAIKILTPENYLIVSQAIIILSYALLLEMNLPKIIQRHHVLTQDNFGKYFGDVMLVSIIAFIISLILLYSYFQSYKLVSLVIITIGTPIIIVINYILVSFELKRKYIQTSLIRQSIVIYTSIAMIYSVSNYADHPEKLLVSIFTIRNLLLIVTLTYLVLSLRINLYLNFNLGLKEILKNQYLTIRNLIDMLMISMDKVIFGLIYGSHIILLTNAPTYDLAMRGLMLITPIISVFFSNSILKNHGDYNIEKIIILCSGLLILLIYPLKYITQDFLMLSQIQYNMVCIYCVGIFLSIPNSFLLSQIFSKKKEINALKFSISYLPVYYCVLGVFLALDNFYAFAISFTLKVWMEMVYFKASIKQRVISNRTLKIMYTGLFCFLAFSLATNWM